MKKNKSRVKTIGEIFEDFAYEAFSRRGGVVGKQDDVKPWHVIAMPPSEGVGISQVGNIARYAERWRLKKQQENQWTYIEGKEEN